MVRAHWNGAVIAESDDTVIIDGNHYFPADSVDERYLVPSDKTTVCPWKGHGVVLLGRRRRSVEPRRRLVLPVAVVGGEEDPGSRRLLARREIEDAGPSEPRRSFLERFRRRQDDASASRQWRDPSVVETTGGSVVVELDDASFFTALDRKVTIVDFWAPWCGPCKQLHPLFDAQAADHAADGVQFARVNVDENPGSPRPSTS
jgi:hypothetical protein